MQETTMGRDIYSETEVLVPISELLPLFNSRKLAVAFSQYCLAYHSALLQILTSEGKIQIRRIWDTERQDEFVDAGFVNDRLAEATKGKDLFSLLKDLTYACQTGGIGKYDDPYIENEQELVRMWKLYIKAWTHFAEMDFPELQSVRTFGSARNCGWAVEYYGHPYLGFSVDQSFRYELTEKGKDLQRALLRKIGPTTFSWVS